MPQSLSMLFLPPYFYPINQMLPPRDYSWNLLLAEQLLVIMTQISPTLWSLVSCTQDGNHLGFEPDEYTGNIHINQEYALSAAAWMHSLIWNLSKILAILPLLGDVTKLLLRNNIKLSYRVVCKCYYFIMSPSNLQVKDKEIISERTFPPKWISEQN